jgi:hypothetical protein
MEDTIEAANGEINNLSTLLVGKILDKEIIQYYASIGNKIDEVDGEIIYFGGLGYEFNKDGLLIKIYPRIVHFKQSKT